MERILTNDQGAIEIFDDVSEIHVDDDTMHGLDLSSLNTGSEEGGSQEAEIVE